MFIQQHRIPSGTLKRGAFEITSERQLFLHAGEETAAVLKNS